MKIPEPLPSVVWLSESDGFWFRLQQTPRSVTAAPPSVVIFPPEVADVGPMLVTAAVVRMGAKLLASLRHRKEKPFVLVVPFVRQ